MKRLLTLLVTAILAVTAVMGLTACNKDELAMGKEMIKADSQLDAVIKLDNGTVDAVVIDSIMAGYYAAKGDYAGKIAIVPNLTLAQEEYGIAGRKDDKAFMSKINEALIALNETKVIDTTATLFGVKDSLAIKSDATDPYKNATDGSWDAIIDSGKIVIGYTLFAPIAYKEGELLTGFDIELARQVTTYLNLKYSADLEVEFLLINWDSKEAMLEEGSIDLVWNGMTITPEREEAMCISIPYLYNKQVAVVKTEELANYTDKASFSDAVIAVEKGSAGESVVSGK